MFNFIVLITHIGSPLNMLVNNIDSTDVAYLMINTRISRYSCRSMHRSVTLKSHNQNETQKKYNHFICSLIKR